MWQSGENRNNRQIEEAFATEKTVASAFYLGQSMVELSQIMLGILWAFFEDKIVRIEAEKKV